MKRLLSVFLLIGLCLASGCANIPDTGVDASVPSWEADIKEKYGSWEPWNYTPGYPMALDAEEAEKYDIEIVMEQTVFDVVPQTVTYTMRNSKDGYLDTFAIFIETYEHPFECYGLEGGGWDIGGWVRIPYYTRPSCGDLTQGERTHTMDIHKFLQREYTYEPGYYRLVFFMPDATHYAYFEIQ